jgi:hypothetical protein
MSKILCNFIRNGGKYKEIFTPPLIDLERFNSYAVVKAIPLQAWKVARLSALRTGRFLPPGNIPGTHFC